MAVDALKEIYYTINTEDPLNAMPARRLVLEQRIVRSSLLPLVNAVHSDPTAESNQKRWSVPMYQTLRLLSVLSIPISVENENAKRGSSLDSNLLKLRADLAQDRSAVHAFVSLLQYYIERKAEKQADLAVAEASKLEDARIDNILRFFRNILSPPRPKVGEDITARDRGVHLTLVGALVHADFYSTMAVLFSSKEDATEQYTDIVFLVADIYAQTYRHTTPRQLYHCYRHAKRVAITNINNDEKDAGEQTITRVSVFDDNPASSTAKLGATKNIKKRSPALANSSRIRAALQRERTFIGGSRVIRSSARWTSRHSGGFQTSAKPISSGQAGTASVQCNENEVDKIVGVTQKISMKKRVVSARNAIQSKLSLNPLHPFQEKAQINSDILCMLAAKGRSVAMKRHVTKSKLSEVMRKDLQDDGLKGIVTLTTELISMSFELLITELRSRIEEVKARCIGEDNEILMKAQNAFLAIVGSVVGFQREKYGKVFKCNSYSDGSLSAEIHKNCMKSILASDFKIAKSEWVAVGAGIELESFQLVFRILVDSCEALKTSGKDEKKVLVVENSTFAVLEMMKMLQGMAANLDDDADGLERQDAENVPGNKKTKATLTSREIALNILEELFEQHEFLNAPADLAKDYTTKLFSFRHLTNIVEITHAFTTILLDEKELAHLQVSKKKSKRGRKRDPAEGKVSNGITISKDKVATIDGSSGGTKETAQVAKEATRIEGGEDSDDQRPESKATAETPNGENDADEKETEEKSAKDSERRETSEDPSQGDDKEQTPQEKTNPGEDSAADDDEALEPELREVESVGIIRRYANAKAIQTLLLPIRAAICRASSLTGSIHNIPDGAGLLISNVIVAKAAHALAAIWKVAKLRERGAMCGQFFTYGTMHMMSVALEAMEMGTVLKHSTLESFSVLARDVSQIFFSWLSLSPGLTLDMFFTMDKGSCQTYATSIGHRKAMYEQQQRAADSGNDSDVSDLAVARRRGNIDFEHIERRASERSARKARKSQRFQQKMAEIRRSERIKIEEDEDVDDIDNLDIGGGMETSDVDSEARSKENHDTVKEKVVKEKPFCRMSKSKRKRRSAEVSKDENAPDTVQRPRSQAPQNRGTLAKSTKRIEAHRNQFESSDEYGEAQSEPDSSDNDAIGSAKVISLPRCTSPQQLVVARSEDENDGETKNAERQEATSPSGPSAEPTIKRRRLIVSDSD